MPGSPPGSREAPAARQALRDLDALLPGRSRASDGIVGDAAHQGRPSDHNLGNAVDLTHDPANGADGAVLAELALSDARSTYVIFNGRIWNKRRGDTNWRLYEGANPHRTHVHVSIAATLRDDVSPWPWSPEFSPYV